MSRSRRSSVDLSAGVAPRSRRSSVDFSAGVGLISRRPSVDYSSGVGPLGLPLRQSVKTGFNSSVGTTSRRSSVDYSAGGDSSMGVFNPRDDLAEWNRGYAEVPLSTVIPRVGNANLQQNPSSLGSAQHGHPSGWKRPSSTEPHLGFFFLHNTTGKLKRIYVVCLGKNTRMKQFLKSAKDILRQLFTQLVFLLRDMFSSYYKFQPSGSYGRQYGTSAVTGNRRYGSMGVSNPRDDRAERNRGKGLGSAQHGHPSGWKRPSTTEPHIGFFFLHNTTEKVKRIYVVCLDKNTRSFDMGTSRYGSSGNKYGSSGYGGSSYLNTSYGTPRTSSYRQSSYEPRISYGGGSVMDRIKQFAPDQSRSYTPLMSRRDYGGGGGGNWDKHSARSGGSDYSNRSGYLSDYGGSNPSLYGSLDRTSSRSGLHSRENSPVTNRFPRNYDYSSSASPSPYSTYKSSSDAHSPSVQRKFERQSSRPSDMYDRQNSRQDLYERQSSRPPEVYERQSSRQPEAYEETPPRPRRRWEQEVYGSQNSRETLPAPVKPPPKDYSDSESDDSAPEDEKGHKLRYMMSRGTSPYHENDKRDYRRKESGTGIAKAKRVKCVQKDSRSGRVMRPELRRKRFVDCAIQTNLDEPSTRRSRRVGGGGDNANTREDVAKLAALALLQEGGGGDGENLSDTFYKYRDKFQQASPGKQQGSKFSFDDSSPRLGRNDPQSHRDPRYHDDSLDVPDEKAWRKAVYGESSPNRSPGLRRHQTEEDLRLAGESARAKRMPKTSTPKKMREAEEDDADYDSPVEERPPSRRERRSYNDSENEKRRSRQSDSEKRRSKQRSSSRDSILDDKPPRRRQRTSSRELLDEPPSPKQKVPLTPDSLSLRDSIDKVESWKQQLPPVNQHLNVDGVLRNPETGFPRSDSGEYFSAVEHNSASGRASRDSERPYKDKMYAQQPPSSPTAPRQELLKSEPDEEVMSPGGRRKRNRRHLSREMSTDSVLDDDDLTHHPINKEKYRKSELNRSEELERFEKEELERRRRIYSGAEDPENAENIRMSGNSSEPFSRDDYGRSQDKRYISRQGSRDDVLDEKRTRKQDRREADAHASDSSQFGFNRESSPNRPSSRTKRHSRNNSRDDVLMDTRPHEHAQYMRPHSMVVSNESLANLSGAGSIASMNSALTNEGPIRNSTSLQSVESNEIQERPPEERFPPSASQQSVNSADSGSSLPDLVPGDEGSRAQVSDTHKDVKRTKSGFISSTVDIDNLLSFSPNEEEFVEKGKDLDEVLKSRHSHLMDTPVPREPSPLKPQVSEEKLIDLDESTPVFSPPPQSPRTKTPPTRTQSLSSQAHSPEHPVSPRFKKAEPEPKSSGEEMWDMLKSKKGLVVIGDILGLCEKPKKKRFIRVPGDEDKSFRGYNTANELLENMQVDTKKLEDCALQIYRYHNGTQGDYGTYLDLESTIDEQSEDLEGFQDQRKNALILRTQLTVRVHAVIEKLLNSSGRELRRALFSLKQIFQDDKDLVHEFVNNDGLDCLIKVGAEADQNYQNYILRALGQVMLYVDGMNGVINHNATIQWLYSLLSSKFRLVVKTALKLLLVFVEYTESNTQHLIKAVNTVDKKRLEKPWTNLMMILDEKDGGDSELLVYAMTLVNKVLNAIPDQDSFYDVTDALEELGMERITQRHMNRKGADLDLLTQFQMYDAALKAEDGEDDEIGRLENLRRTPRIKSEEESGRKSRRFSTGVMPGKNRANNAPFLNQDDTCPAEDYKSRKQKMKEMIALPPEESEQVDKMPDQRKRWSKFSQNKENEEQQRYVNGAQEKSPPRDVVNDLNKTETSVGDTPRSRRERRARQRDFIKAQENGIMHEGRNRLSLASNSSTSTCSSVGSGQVPAEAVQDTKYSSLSSLSDAESLDNQNRMGREPPDKQGYHQGNQLEDTKESGYHSNFESANNVINQSLNQAEDSSEMQGISNNRRWLMYKMAHKEIEDEPEDNYQKTQAVPAGDSLAQRKDNLQKKQEPSSVNKKLVDQFEKDTKVKAGLERFGKQTEEMGPTKTAGPTGDRTGLITQAMENLTKKTEPVKPEPVIKKPDTKLTESDLQWERLAKRFHRLLKLHDMDFTDLKDDEDSDVFAPPKLDFDTEGPPLPPPPGGIPPPPGMMPPPPPPAGGLPPPPPPPTGLAPPPPPPPGGGPLGACPVAVNLPPPAGANLKKNKKTVKLHWKTVQPEMPHPATKGETIWKDVVPVKVDAEKLEHLFENRASDVKQKRQEAHGKKQITVLDPKRSNAINIGLTVLPPPRTIKAAILKMDNSIMNREGIEKVLNGMIPSEEEKAKILEAQLANPDIPLGTAEQFLLTLSSISELQARLQVWLFKLEYETIEMEVAEPLMDLKKGIEELMKNKTFKYIISALLTIGNFLNGSQVRGFSVDYLTRVPEVKDTVHKHSLLHHLCTIIIEQFQDSTDLYSEIGPITRCSRVDWDELQKKLDKLEEECKASWDNLRAIVKHDGSSNSQLKSKMSEFLGDSAERIMILQIVHRRVMNRYNKLLLYMGFPLHQARELKVNQFCKTLSEFALEYRTTREKVVQMLEKKATQRERKKTRGKMIVDMGKFKGSRSNDDQGEDALQRVLANGYTSETDRGLPGRQARKKLGPADSKRHSVSSRGCATTDSEMYDTGDDEILEACVRTATTPSTRNPRERKRARNSRKSLRRTLKSGLSPEEVSAVAGYSEKV